MSISRRLELLEWARRNSAHNIEDDYDSEIRCAGLPLASLQGLNDHHRVSYLGTFSKVLTPSLRLCFVIFLPELVGPALSVCKFMEVHPPSFDHAVLANFIAESHFSRHLRRMRTLYAARREAFLEMYQELPLTLAAPEAGLHCIGWLPEGISEEALLNAAKRYELALVGLSWFRLRFQQKQGILMGFGGYHVLALRETVDRLKFAFRSLERDCTQA